MAAEVWAPIGFNSAYAVSNHGRVRGVRKDLLRPALKADGYLQVGLPAPGGGRHAGGLTKQFYVHRLVAEVFTPNPDGKKVVNHIDGNRANNAADNLEWVTNQENCQRKVRPNYGNRCRPVVQKTVDGKIVNRWPSATQAASSLGVSRIGISECCRGISRTAGGWVWAFADETDGRPEGEEWAPIPGQKGARVSNLGFMRTKTGVLSRGTLKAGYYVGVGGVGVHRLVATAFCPNPGNKSVVNHLDGNKLNNTASNLEWATLSENSAHAYATGLRKTKGVLWERPGGHLAEYLNVAEASRATGLSADRLRGYCKTEWGGWRYAGGPRTEAPQPAPAPRIADDDPIWAELGL
jgi:hypothetical protein